MDIIKKLLEYRINHHISRKQVETATGINQYVLKDIENGKIRLKVDDFLLLCSYYNLDIASILNNNSDLIFIEKSTFEELKLLQTKLSNITKEIENKNTNKSINIKANGNITINNSFNTKKD